MIRRRLKYTDKDAGTQKRKSAWHYLFMVVLIMMFALTTVSMQGCAGQSAKQRAITEWQTEGHYVYAVDDNGKEYFVRCANGQKFVGFWIPETGHYQLYGPMDACTGEE